MPIGAASIFDSWSYASERERERFAAMIYPEWSLEKRCQKHGELCRGSYCAARDGEKEVSK